MEGSERTRPYSIVVGVDFSEVSAEALRQAFGLAGHHTRAEVHVVNVVRNFGEFVILESAQPSLYGVSLQEASERLREFAAAEQRRCEAARGRPCCGRVVTHLRSEVPAEEITHLASELDADLIVVGTHGRRGVRRLVLGSVAESVVRLAPCPVLVVRPPRELPTRADEHVEDSTLHEEEGGRSDVGPAPRLPRRWSSP
jgi:nucleotide-binding universal stress UspA family protein